MYLDDLKIGTLLSVQIKRFDMDFFDTCSVQDVGKGIVTILEPKLPDGHGEITDKDTIVLRFSDDGRLMEWLGEKISVTVVDDIRFVEVQCPTSGQSINRRQWFRVVLNTTGVLKFDDSTTLEVLLFDLSGTGLGFISKEDIEMGKIFRTVVKDGGTALVLDAHIVRKDASESDGFSYGAELLGVSDDQVSRFISFKQRELLRKRQARK